jgi:phage terminase small subunit
MKRSASLDENGLDQREALFVGFYLSNGGNAKRAAASAGYTGDTGARGASMIRKPEVAKLIRSSRLKKLSALDIKAERVLIELARIAFADVRKLFQPDGSLVPLRKLDADSAGAIATVQVGRGGSMIRLKFASKISALDLLGRYLGLWDADGKVAGKDSIDQLIEAMRNPVQDTPAPGAPPKKLRIM